MEGLKKLVSDRLRTRAAREEAAAPSAVEHIDADTLSAFAECALSDSERTQVLHHLGGCSECRETLYLALPSSPEVQRVLAAGNWRRTGFALRWGTLAAVVAIGAVLLISTRRHTEVSLYKAVAVPKAAAPGSTAADLKTPPEIAEMHALRDDRASTSTATEKGADKVIPTPKRMTARPSANFDIDQTGQVRISPRFGGAVQDGLSAQGRNFTELSKLDSSSAPAAAPAMGAVGGTIQNNNSLAHSATFGQSPGPVPAPPGAVNGTIVDPSGAVVPNATVTMVGPVGTRAVQSDKQGQFAFDRLSPGPYSVRAQAPGFQTTELQQVAILANKPANLQLTLQLGTTSETVEVTGAAQQQVVVSAEQAQPAQAEVDTKSAAPTQAQTSKVAQNRRQVNQAAKNEAVLKKGAGVGSAGNAFFVSQPQWTLAPDGTVQRSLDQGSTWHAVHVSGATRFRGLSSVGADVWVGGSAGALYHSADSGQTWTRVVPSAAGRKLESDIARVDFSDALSGTVTTVNGQSWTTSDGGQSWDAKP